VEPAYCKGAVVQNVECAFAVNELFQKNKPLLERVIRNRESLKNLQTSWLELVRQ
jgi:Na+-translocating ferredoxin:NAD+ oxidoreductase RnfC subunit